MDFRYGSFFKLYLEHISRVRNCRDHVLLCFPLTRDVICTVGLCPAYIAAPMLESLLTCIKRASCWPFWRLPGAVSGLCHPNVFIVAETQLESPELENNNNRRLKLKLWAQRTTHKDNVTGLLPGQCFSRCRV